MMGNRRGPSPHRSRWPAVAVTVLLVGGCGTPTDPPPTPPAGDSAGPPTELVIETLRAGDGETIASGDIAVVRYTGWLYVDDAPDNKGTQFDSRPSFRFPLGEGRVIRGWEQGVEGMRVGEQRRLVIPPDLAYGDRGTGDGAIPAGATLVFDVELLGVE